MSEKRSPEATELLMALIVSRLIWTGTSIYEGAFQIIREMSEHRETEDG